jgi:hypothetical protein
LALVGVKVVANDTDCSGGLGGSNRHDTADYPESHATQTPADCGALHEACSIHWSPLLANVTLYLIFD